MRDNFRWAAGLSTTLINAWTADLAKAHAHRAWNMESSWNTRERELRTSIEGHGSDVSRGTSFSKACCHFRPGSPASEDCCGSTSVRGCRLLRAGRAF